MFGSNSENNSDNSRKINNENILFTSTYARNFLEKMIDFNNKNNDIDILEIPFPSKISYSEDFIKSFNIKLNQYYKNNTHILGLVYLNFLMIINVHFIK